MKPVAFPYEQPARISGACAVERDRHLLQGHRRRAIARADSEPGLRSRMS